MLRPSVSRNGFHFHLACALREMLSHEGRSSYSPALSSATHSTFSSIASPSLVVVTHMDLMYPGRLVPVGGISPSYERKFWPSLYSAASSSAGSSSCLVTFSLGIVHFLLSYPLPPCRGSPGLFLLGSLGRVKDLLDPLSDRGRVLIWYVTVLAERPVPILR